MEQHPGGGLNDGFMKAEELRLRRKKQGWRFIQDRSGFELSASITSPFYGSPIPFYFFPPVLEVVMTILNSFHGERLSPSHFDFIHWSDTVE